MDKAIVFAIAALLVYALPRRTTPVPVRPAPPLLAGLRGSAATVSLAKTSQAS